MKNPDSGRGNPAPSERPTRIQSSKIMLALAAAFGLALLPLGLFAELNNLIVYALILAVAVFNRLDSRARGYKFSLQAGAAQAAIEATGEEE